MNSATGTKPNVQAARIAQTSPTAPLPHAQDTLNDTTDARQARDGHLAALLAQAAAGNSTAYEQFFDTTAAQARACARRLLRGDDIDELLADVYFEAWRKLAQFDPTRGSAMTWLMTLLRSRALDMLRRHATHPSVGGGDESAAELPSASADDPAEQLWRQQAGSQLHRAIAGLSAPERWVLGLAYFRELTHQQIAISTGLPLGTVKSHLLRAHRKLRLVLSP